MTEGDSPSADNHRMARMPGVLSVFLALVQLFNE